MNPQSNPAWARLRKFILVTSLFIAPFLAFQTGHAQSVATATLTSGGLNSITIGPNETFTLTLGVTTNFVSAGYTVFYQSNNGSGLFEITGRTSLDPIFPFPGIDPTPFPLLLNPSDMFDLGAVANTPDLSHPAGTFDLQAVMIHALNAPVGTYTIFLDNRSIMVDRPVFQDVPMGGASGPMFTVHVVPEPATMGLLAMAGGALSLLAWRKRRGAAPPHPRPVSDSTQPAKINTRILS
jgi:hypothetical protein